jgi:O-antigen ligase
VSRNVILGGSIAFALIAVIASVFYATSDLKAVEAELNKKFHLAEKKSLDDREPMRRATWAMVSADDSERLWAGYGAGSYRWKSPEFFVKEKEFQRKNKTLRLRANYAHCDWLQMLVEWGVVGISFVILALLWMVFFLVKNFRRWTPITWVLVCAVFLFMAHATMDFLNYSMPLLCMVVFVACGASKLGFVRKPV